MKSIASATAIALAAIAAPAQAADAGFATQVAGTVAFKDGSPLAAFAKVRSGDQLAMKPGAKLQLVYFESGRQETWAGPCALAVGERASSSARDCAPPAVKELPQAVLNALLNTPDMISDIRNRSGMVRVRSVPKHEQIKAAEDQYQALRAQAAEDDITPELYLFSRLWSLQQATALGETLAIMEKRQPKSAEVASLRAKYQELMGSGKKPQ
jgi:hypothetical protein